MDNAVKPSADLGGTTQQSSTPSSDEVDWTGQVLGEFRLLHRLGRGGMGQVYLAEQTSLKRKVALKLLHPELAANERSLLRFKAEAENVARATHANIVQIHTIGQANGVNYLALEYVEGKNLREFIEKKGTPELSLGLHVMAQVAAALQRASELGIIHRDIKPENILLTKKGEVKVADFGLSRCFAEETQQSITQSQVTMGTPLYMSPEQVERGNVDRRTDIYSFGVTCYHMFAGTPPFRGTSPIEVAYQHVHKDPQPLHDIRPDLPAELCAIVQKMMAKKPEERYQTAGEIVRDIQHLREVLKLGAIGPVSISSSFLGGASDALKYSGTNPVTRPSYWLPVVLIGSVLLALAGGVAFGWYHNHSHPFAKDPPPIMPPDDPALVKKPVMPKTNEKELRELVQKYLDPESHAQVMTGLELSRRLGVFYINERRYDDADAFFLDLSKGERNVPAYSLLGNLGHAIVLAFKDDYAASNKEFLLIAADLEKMESRLGVKGGKKDAPVLKSKVEAYKYLWKDNPPIMRELAARALNRNYINSPKDFPADKLDVYRFPPRPTLKAMP